MVCFDRARARGGKGSVKGIEVGAVVIDRLERLGYVNCDAGDRISWLMGRLHTCIIEAPVSSTLSCVEVALLLLPSVHLVAMVDQISSCKAGGMNTDLFITFWRSIDSAFDDAVLRPHRHNRSRD